MFILQERRARSSGYLRSHRTTINNSIFKRHIYEFLKNKGKNAPCTRKQSHGKECLIEKDIRMLPDILPPGTSLDILYVSPLGPDLQIDPD